MTTEYHKSTEELRTALHEIFELASGQTSNWHCATNGGLAWSAKTAVEKLLTGCVEYFVAIKEHNGFDCNNCAMKPNEQIQAMRNLAELALIKLHRPGLIYPTKEKGE